MTRCPCRWSCFGTFLPGGHQTSPSQEQRTSAHNLSAAQGALRAVAAGGVAVLSKSLSAQNWGSRLDTPVSWGPIRSWKRCSALRKPQAGPPSAGSGEDSLLCPGMRRVSQQRRRPPKPAPPGRGGSQCHPHTGTLTCRGARLGDSGQKRRGGQQQRQAPTAPARSGRGRASEAEVGWAGWDRARGSGTHLGAMARVCGAPGGARRMEPSKPLHRGRAPLSTGCRAPPARREQRRRLAAKGSRLRVARFLNHRALKPDSSSLTLRRHCAPPRAARRAHARPDPGVPTPLSPATDARSPPRLT